MIFKMMWIQPGRTITDSCQRLTFCLVSFQLQYAASPLVPPSSSQTIRVYIVCSTKWYCINKAKNNSYWQRQQWHKECNNIACNWFVWNFNFSINDNHKNKLTDIFELMICFVDIVGCVVVYVYSIHNERMFLFLVLDTVHCAPMPMIGHNVDCNHK